MSLAEGELEPKQARNYRALLRRIHRRRQPRTYVEIGVGTGRSLALARPGTLCVGIDPAPNLRRDIPDSATVFELTSDEFFAQHDLRDVLSGRSVDFAFIDGMHLFEFALRDFMHLERACGRNSVIAIHDCLPPNPAVASRQQRAGFWTGDVWKLVACLGKHRPDLVVSVVDVPPSGLAIVTGVDASSQVLERRYADLCDEFIDQEYTGEPGSVVPASWGFVRDLIPGRDGDPVKVRIRDLSSREPIGASAVGSVHELHVPGAGPREIALHGFPEPVLEKVLEPARSLEIRSGKPAIHRFRNLTFVPKFSALYDEDGRRVLETCVRRGPGLTEIAHRTPDRVELSPSAPGLEDPVVYCGRLQAHWGHFLTETISRLWALSDPGIPDDVPVLFQRAKRRAGDGVRQFFGYVGVDQDRFVDLDSVTTLGDVLVPDPSFALGGEAFRRHLALPERVAEAIVDVRPSEQPVYLSRGGILSRRRIAGEDRLEDLLRDRGVMIVSPETMSYEDQVRLFNRHSVFIGCAGSAFHSLLYALPDRSPRTAVIVPNAPEYYELPPRYVDLFLTDALKQIQATYLFHPGDPTLPVAETMVDSAAVVEFLERQSLI